MSKNPDKDRALAKDTTFALEQTVACLGTDFIDPPVTKWVQNRFGKPEHAGTDVHEWKSEFVGDASAIFVFLGAQKYCPGLVQGLKHGTRKVLDPMFEKIGNNRLKEWAARHDVDPKSDEFRAKLEEFKDFQAENLAKASVISTASIAANVAAQIAMGNKRSVGLIAASKVAGQAVTLAVTTVARNMAPRTMHKIDTKISDKVVLPAIKATHKLLGIENSAEPAADAAPGPVGEARKTDIKKAEDFRARLSDKSEPQYGR